jgi:hypothetical protein
MSKSTSHSPSHSGHSRGSHGGGSHGHDGGGGGGGGGGGKLVKIAFARNLSEAEMLQGLLSEAGIPSVLKRSGGFDTPEFMAAGPRDVMVNSEQARKAREVLADTLIEDESEERAELQGEARLARGEGTTTTPATLAMWIGAALVGALILVWVLYQLTS